MKSSAIRRLVLSSTPTFARTFSAGQGTRFVYEIMGKLRNAGFEVPEINGFKNMGSFFEIHVKAQKKDLQGFFENLGWSSWMWNPEVLTIKKFDWPVSVEDNVVYCLGQSCPRWVLIRKTLSKLLNVEVPKPKWDKENPIGSITIVLPPDSLDSAISSLKKLGFDSKTSTRLFSVEDDLEVLIKGNQELVVQQPVSERPDIVKKKPPSEIELKKQERDNSHAVRVAESLPEHLVKPFDLARANRNYAQQWMFKLHDYFSQKYFAGKLERPHIGFLRGVDINNMRKRAHWSSRKRALEFHPALIHGTFASFIETFVHEMCHQAVTDINRTVEHEQKGHGPLWSGWMRRCGLLPLRFDDKPNSFYKSEKIIQTEQKKEHELKSYEDEIERTHHRPDFHQLEPGLAVLAPDSDRNLKYFPGVLITNQDKYGYRWAVLHTPSTRRLTWVPRQKIFLLTNEEGRLFMPVLNSIEPHIDLYLDALNKRRGPDGNIK